VLLLLTTLWKAASPISWLHKLNLLDLQLDSVSVKDSITSISLIWSPSLFWMNTLKVQLYQVIIILIVRLKVWVNSVTSYVLVLSSYLSKSNYQIPALLAKWLLTQLIKWLVKRVNIISLEHHSMVLATLLVKPPDSHSHGLVNMHVRLTKLRNFKSICRQLATRASSREVGHQLELKILYAKTTLLMMVL